MNGQYHGGKTASFFTRKKISLSYICKSLLVIVDCSNIKEEAFFQLFMGNRETTVATDLMKDIELTLIVFHIVVLMGSYYIFNLKPEPFVLKMYNFELSLGRKDLFLADIVIHWFTFLILILVVFRKKKNLLNTFNLKLLILLPLVYLILNNPIDVYQLDILGYKNINKIKN